MSTTRLLIAGLVATIAGSFLPWRYTGDWLRYPEYGIRIFPTYLYSAHARWLVPGIEDHGGVMVLVLSIALGIALFLLPKQAERLRPWTVAGAAALLLLSLFHVAELAISGLKSQSPGAPTMGIGLVLVTLGSILVMTAVWRLQIHRAQP